MRRAAGASAHPRLPEDRRRTLETLLSRWARSTRWQKALVVVGLAVALYAAAGFGLAPWVVRAQAEQALRDQLGREARIDQVRINPFALSLTVRGLEIPDADGSPFLRLEELYVDFQVSSLFRRAYTFDQIRLGSPFVHVKVLPDGGLNFADLLASAEGPAESEPVSEADPPSVLVFLARIDGGRIVFSDLSRPTPFEHEIAPLDVELRNFGTRRDHESSYGFTATTGAGEKLEWEGQVSIVPFASAGRFALTHLRPRTGWLYLQDQVLFEIVEGTVDVVGRYRLDARDGLRVTLEEGAVRVRDFELLDRETRESALAVPQLDVEGISLAYPEGRLRVASVAARGTRSHVLRLESGELRSQRFAARAPSEAEPGEEPADGQEQARSGPGPSGSNPPWRVVVDEVALEEMELLFEDRVPRQTAKLRIRPLSLQVQGLSNEPGATARVALGAALEERGRIRIAGDVGLQPLLVDLELEASEIDVTHARPYLEDVAALELDGGRVAFAGRLRARAEAGEAEESERATEPLLRYDGSLELADLRTRDRTGGDELVSLGLLSLEGLGVAVGPTSLRLDRVLLREPAARIVVGVDGGTNLARVASGGASGNGPPAAGPSPEPAGPAREPVPLAIGRVEIERGRAQLEDRSVDPAFAASIDQLSGRVDEISTEPSTRTRLALTGRVDGAALRIQGAMRPFATRPSGDLRLALESLGLTPFTPYSGRYVGQTIERGNLSLDLEYTLADRVLAGENAIFLDQLALGRSVESPDAVDLPVGLAIGLLKDASGEIHVDLPVRGDVDDPEFSLGGMILGALTNLVTKAATSPFALVGGLVGADGESLQFVEFAPGAAELGDAEREKLGLLAAALAERPALSLEIAGTAAPAADRPALQAAALQARLRQLAFEKQSARWFGEKPESVEDVELDPQSYDRLLQQAYRDRFDEDPERLLHAVAGAADVEGAADEPDRNERLRRAMQLRLRDAIEVDEDALRALARRRAAAVREQLVGVGGVAPARVFVLEETVVDGTGSESVRTRLSLTAG